MLIERAIEKLKHAGGVPEAPSVQRARRARAGGEKRGVTALVPEDRPEPKVAFPELELDPATLRANRILDPASSLGRDAAGVSAFRMMRSRMLHKMRTAGWTTLAITSPGPGEGKTLVSINLALSMAREGASDVFLLDFDMRNPSVCRTLGIAPRAEIVDYFRGAAPVEELFSSIGNDGLAVAGGQISSNSASEYVASGRFEQLVDYIKSVAFNPVIVIDLPPILVSDEAVVLGPRVDAMALVVAEGRTSREGLTRTRQLLHGQSFAGVILNRSSDALGTGDYYGYYGAAK
jgi:capsular exopolysaccharide synthesis family protein